ncbi:MAG: hypothetical protein ACJ785_07060 [Gemmatimonadaceae bacterium]
MADFTKNTTADMAADKPDINFGTTANMHEIDWPAEDEYWRSNFSSKPYVRGDRNYDYYRPAYRYGAESAMRHNGKDWNSVQGDLERGWDKYRGDAKSTWQDIKDAVRDGWNRVRGSLS